MDINFEKAFSFITEDKEWKKKISIGGGLSLLTVIVFVLPFLATLFRASAPLAIGLLGISILLCTVIILALVGYPYQVAYNRINNTEEILPDWKNFGVLVLTGIKSCVGYFLYTLPLSIAMLVMTGLFALGAIGDNPSLKVLFLILGFTVIFVLMVLSFIYMLAYYLMMTSFSKDLKVLSYIDFKSAYRMLKNNWLNYLILFLLVIAVSVIMQFALMILFCTIIGIIFIPAMMFYLSIVNADLLAQFAKTQKE